MSSLWSGTLVSLRNFLSCVHSWRMILRASSCLSSCRLAVRRYTSPMSSAKSLSFLCWRMSSKCTMSVA